MSELLQVAGALMRASRDKEVRVLATVVGTEGSTYRRIGARLVAFPDGSHVGSVSAGASRGTCYSGPNECGAPAWRSW
jgi:xanthine dehydrogenase accessory factor